MTTILLIIHLLIALALVGVILLQRSEGGALGIGGGGGGGAGGGLGGLMSGRASANLLTRTTAFLAVGFIATSLTLAIIASNRTAPTSILDQPVGAAPAATETPAAPEAPAEPAAPTAD
ncbi:MAG: preprotein translocase subunit SecG [Alphaproteobacteria bacterium]|nr:preprotein translocase subunit SecG [Alphaproteobacteria bacterium]